MGTEIEISGYPIPPERVPDSFERLRQLTAAWLLGKRSLHTRISYQRDLLGTSGRLPGWIIWCDDHQLEPLQVRRGHVDAYARSLEASGYSPASVARRLSALSSWYEYLAAEGLMDSNPVAQVDRPEVDRDTSHAVGLSEKEIGLFLAQAEADGDRASALMRLLLYDGLRVGSALNANVSDLGYDKGHRTLRLTLKGGARRRVLLVAPICDALDLYLDSRTDLTDDAPLFATDSGNRLGEPYVWRLVRRLARRAGIPSANLLNPHSLRHTFATEARELGVPLEDVQDAMGHKDPRTTRRYDRARNRLDRHPGLALAARFSKGGEQ